jgi:biotin carboxyl carrier protein
MRRYTIEVAGQKYVIDVQEITADRYQVTAEGQEFEVRLTGEDVAETAIRPEILPLRSGPGGGAPPARVAAPPAPAGPPPATPHLETPRVGMLAAPMPGKVLSVEVAAGEAVSHGQVLLTLEAMKMKNSIRAPQDGVVLEVLVQPGQGVAHGTPLLRLGEA